jgi:hypothetical protein
VSADELASAAAPEVPAGSTRPARWRSVVAILLVVLAAFLAPLTVTAVWLHERILSTDGYVETVAPLVDDPAVTDAIATRVVDELFQAADVQKRVTDALPGPVDALGRTFTNSLRNLATTQTENLLESDAFAKLWEQANRVAHEQVVSMFSGKGDAVSKDDNAVVLDLGVVADKVRLKLVDQGVGILERVSIPKGSIEVTLFESDLIPKLQTAFRVLDNLAAILPVLLVAVVIAAIALAPRRRRIVVGVGLGVAAATSLVLVGLDLGRRETVSQATSADLDTDATKAVYDTLVTALRDWAWLLMVFGLFVALVALVSNPGWIGGVAEKLRGSSPEIPAPAAWVRQNRLALSAGVIGVALLTLVVWPTPTLLVVALVVLVTAFVLALVTALARMKGSVAPEAAGPPEGVDQVG